MEYLTVKEVAELKGCSEQYVKKIIKDGKLSAEQTVNEKSRPKYLIPVSDCYKLTRSWVTEECPEYLPFMASERTFRRQTYPPKILEHHLHLEC